ncbi:hypothetical protein PW5551_00995 [Petrotoga sp. 9PW.55.5.1]|uniref:HPP family protein n=1 Tax=Petrotoga sp. 9PW.55.5.1 TaxID=1308979 RepID=UPI000DC4AE8D|nr:HPP family protein [Petrotoga sp. 9PW.55.5.1]RAO99990.1 hypothetical protein PW5551_00995 [Petrotoga sp. 9PW.55.5.1]
MRIFEILSKFKANWKNYVLQSILATITVFFIFTILNVQERPIIVSSMGATTFIVFAMPKSMVAKARNIIGGHAVGFICGSLFSLIFSNTGPLFSNISYALAVGLSIFIMVVIDTEHPPAAGTALSLCIFGFSLNAFLSVFLSIIILSIVHHFLKPYMIDLI